MFDLLLIFHTGIALHYFSFSLLIIIKIEKGKQKPKFQVVFRLKVSFTNGLSWFL